MHLICFTKFGTFPKASWWAPIIHPSRGSPSFHLCWGSSSGCDAGSSTDWSNPVSHPGKLCGHLVLAESSTIVGLAEREGEEVGPFGLMVCCGVAIRRPVRDMFPVSNCMGYISMPRDSAGQAQWAVPQACRKDWWACHPPQWPCFPWPLWPLCVPVINQEYVPHR